MNSKFVFIFLIIYLQNIVSCEKNGDKINSEEIEVFVPTHKWQVIKEGQSIPAGLHIRINLQTGLKEAKLSEPAKEQTTLTVSHAAELNNTKSVLEVAQPAKEDKEEIKETDSNSYSPEELKNVLKKIKSDENLPPTDELDVKRVKEKFKDYDELKKELGDLNMSVKTDAEILRDLFKKFNNVISNKNLSSDEKDAEILSILVNIEYLIHQIDNANEFINLNGFPIIIYKNLNSTNSDIISESLNILGSCIQNNAKAQINALETGAFDIILRLLTKDSTANIKMRAIFSLSSLLRRFPLAQIQFIKNDGLNIFAKLFSKQENMKLQLKVLTLIYDLLVEEHEGLGDEKDTEKFKQYKAVNLKNSLIKNNWCPIFNNVLINNAKIKDKDDDAIERCLNVMIMVTDHCLTTFNNKNLLNTLQEFNEEYKNLSSNESVDDPQSFPYFTHLKNLTHHMLSVISSVKTEL